MKKIIIILLIAVSSFALVKTTVPYRMSAGTAARASEVLANFDSLDYCTDRIIDTINYLRTNQHVDTMLIDTANIDWLEVDTVTSIDTLYGMVLKSQRLRSDTVNATYGNFTLFDTVNATYGNFTLFDTVNATYGNFTLFDTVNATYGNFTLLDTIRATYDTTKIIVSDSMKTRTLVTTGNLGVGTTPSYRLHVVHDQNAVSYGLFKNNTSGNLAAMSLGVASNSSDGYLSAYDTNNSNAEYADKTVLLSGTGSKDLGIFATGSTAGIDFYTGGNAAGNKQMTITSSGFVGIDTTTPESKLHVAGSLRVRDTIISTRGIYMGNLNTLTGDITTDSIKARTIKVTGNDPSILVEGELYASLYLNRQDSNYTSLIEFNSRDTLNWWMGTGRTEMGNGNNFSIGNANGNPILITPYPNGYVGIDTITPGSKLHVAGSARVRDSVITNYGDFQNLKIRNTVIDSLAFIDGTNDTLVISVGAKTWKFVPVADQ